MVCISFNISFEQKGNLIGPDGAEVLVLALEKMSGMQELYLVSLGFG